ncbi:phosphopantetheine-binding protein [Streptococcus pseudoporcinus]|uniref:Acyl carrier protein n=1 Tax=Streptococcus pseudoporcinus TaxID=361101 RepID=A0A4U9XH64_9STRE|nr:phosphopantetheine-binding protein [Streptococcus pseudoporcinus]VTS12266.1 acyl carrier protein [Streptococcus pseudoporcinus]VUC64792.1 acyl carrier protein [Streptococcus pseudoporcinus]VUC95266.1 acyl carrier protein [Streptococcus pseudoporcinus]VUC95472.1 acyl carrier protein [Streptococcus pseudoporcinus]
MTRKIILEKLQDIIREQDVPKKVILDEQTSLKDDLGVDSIELTEFIINVEDSFNLSIPDEDVEELIRIGDLIDYLLERLEK